MSPSYSLITPRALNTFPIGIAELGIDKGLIKNKKLLSDENESNNEESSSDIENNEEEEEEEVASENGVEAEGTQESDNDTEKSL